MAGKEYHINLAPGDIPGYVLLPGDPDRVPLIAKHLEQPEEVTRKREFVTWRGFFEGIPVAICSTGIGCPSAAIAVEELIKVGAHTFIRVGSAGSLQEHIEVGHLVVSTGSIREDGTTRQYLPLSYPAVPDPDVVFALRRAAAELGLRHSYGVTHCKDSFYSEIREMAPAEETNESLWRCWERAGVLATSMESSAIFIISTIRGVRSAEVLLVVGSTHQHEPIGGSFDMTPAIQTALNAVVILDKEVKTGNDNGVYR